MAPASDFAPVVFLSDHPHLSPWCETCSSEMLCPCVLRAAPHKVPAPANPIGRESRAPPAPAPAESAPAPHPPHPATVSEVSPPPAEAPRAGKSAAYLQAVPFPASARTRTGPEPSSRPAAVVEPYAIPAASTPDHAARPVSLHPRTPCAPVPPGRSCVP